jgi:glycine/D-amino acid oxidase-like deaminating enzyme
MNERVGTGMHVVVCGGGVIGGAVGYALSQRGVTVTIVERWRPGGAASGKSGGFLARDWCDGTPVEALARRSFDLHAEWAEALGNPYGYRRVDTFGAVMSARRALAGGGLRNVADWLSNDAIHRSRLGSTKSTAQLDPEAFTCALVDAVVSRGGHLCIGTVAGLAAAEGGTRARGVTLEDGRTIEADAVVLAMGPWMLMAAQWLTLPPVYGLKGHSVVFRPEKTLPAEAIFAEFEDTNGELLTPEIMPRVDGTLYICGLSGSAPLPVDPSRVAPEEGGCKKLREIAIRLVPQLASAAVVAEQACYRPIMSDGLPLIGRHNEIDGVFVATGHSVWGMLNAPGTGDALAELITSGHADSLDLAAFAPSRLAPLDPSDLQLRAGDPN